MCDYIKEVDCLAQKQIYKLEYTINACFHTNEHGVEWVSKTALENMLQNMQKEHDNV
jgi:hypothetical protein